MNMSEYGRYHRDQQQRHSSNRNGYQTGSAAVDGTSNNLNSGRNDQKDQSVSAWNVNEVLPQLSTSPNKSHIEILDDILDREYEPNDINSNPKSSDNNNFNYLRKYPSETFSLYPL